MKILVCIKQVINAYARVLPNDNHDGVVATNARNTINPFDEIAIEAAVQLKEQHAAEVITLAVGDASVQEQLRKSLAMGADRSILLTTDTKLLTLDIAKAIVNMAKNENVDLILLGKQSTDGDYGHVGPMVAGLLGWPQMTFASEIEFVDGKLQVTREVDSGLLTVAAQLPAVITCDLRLNEPRYPSLPNIVKAKQKPMQVIDFASLSIELMNNHHITSYTAPAVRAQGKLLKDVDELLSTLPLKRIK